MPVLVNPVFQNALNKARVYRLGDSAGIKEAKIDRAIALGLSPNQANNSKLTALVEEEVITSEEAKSFGLSANLYALFDSSFELLEAVLHTDVPNSMKDLIKLSRADWQNRIQVSGVVLPDDLSQEDYAEVLFKKVENLYPEDSLINNVGRVVVGEIAEGLGVMQQLFEENEIVFGKGSFDDLKTDHLPADQLETVRVQFEAFDRMAKTHAGLGLYELFNNSSLSVGERGELAETRISVWDRFQENNPEASFLSLRYTHDSEDINTLNFEGFEDEEIKMLIQTIKPYQRIFSVTKDIEHAELIVGAGLHSAFDLSRTDIIDIIEMTGLDRDALEIYILQAKESITYIAASVATMLEIETDTGEGGPGLAL